VLAVLLLNAPFWILASHAFVVRASISLDSLLALMILQYSAWLGLIAVSLSWLLDLTANTAMTYHFASALEFIRSISFAPHLDWSQLLEARSLYSGAPFVFALVALSYISRVVIGTLPIALAIFALLVLDTLNGSSALSGRDVRIVPGNVAGSSMYAMGRMLLNSEGDPALLPTPSSGGWAELNEQLPIAGSSQRSVLYVIVESFGLHRKSIVQEWLSKQLVPTALIGRYQMRQGSVAASGGTTAGELRRLCGLQGSYLRFDAEATDHCIPHKFVAQGFHTIGLHGFSEKMFDRKTWWPTLGLQEMQFGEQMRTNSSRECGAAFRGLCDNDLISTAMRAAQAQRTFVYTLTLNSHLPLAPIEIPDDLAVVCDQAKTGPDVCMLIAHLGVTLRAIATELAQQSANPFVLVTGDHAPPFSESLSREQFLPRTVPLFALTPVTENP
jgi:hypothetical protein